MISFGFIVLYGLTEQSGAGLTMRATKSERCRPYLATTGRRTSVTGLVGLAFRPTERLMGTRSSLEKKNPHQRLLGSHTSSTTVD